MANKTKTKKSSKTKSSETNSASVVRIRASAPDSKTTSKSNEVTKKTPAVKTKTVKAKKVKKIRTGLKAPRFLRAIGGYFKGAWVELRQVRWPTRSATWGMTAAVLAYSAFFVVFVLLLDAGFKYLFELILKQ